MLQKMETRRLTNSDMKKLVRIFRNHPHNASASAEAQYHKLTKQYIHDLPNRLRSSRLSILTTNLCSVHKGLDANLVNDIWAWIRHEFEDQIGPFLYPIIMSGRLGATREINARQLEPILEMWHPRFTAEASAAIGHAPIDCGDKWKFQEDQCPGCMLARIGSDERVLFALFAGMVGHFNTRSLVLGEVDHTIVGWEKTKSRRIRFVRYWIRAIENGDKLVSEAGEVGMQLRRMRRELVAEQRRTQNSNRSGNPGNSLPVQVHSTREHSAPWTPLPPRSGDAAYARSEFEATNARHTPTRDAFGVNYGGNQPRSVAEYSDAVHRRQSRDRTQEGLVDLSEPYQYKDWSKQHDENVGQGSRLSESAPRFRGSVASFDMRGLLISIDEAQAETSAFRLKSTDQRSSVYSQSPDISTEDLIPSPLQPRQSQQTTKAAPALRRKAPTAFNDRADSVMAGHKNTNLSPPRSTNPYALSITSTILSYDGPGVSVVGRSRGPVYDPLDAAIYNPVPTFGQDHQRYRDDLRYAYADLQDPYSDDASTLPQPKRTSIYRGFGAGRAKDKYAAVDEDIPHEEIAGGEYYDANLGSPYAPQARR